MLRSAGVGDAFARRTHELLDRLEAMHYGAGRSDAQAAERLSSSIGALLKDLDRALERRRGQELGDLLASNDDNAAALEAYRKALALLRGAEGLSLTSDAG